MPLVTLLLLLWTVPACAATVQTARGSVEIEDGSTWHGINQTSGTIEGLHDVTFIGCMLARQEPHSVVFKDCTNLTFIDCNLVNVELQKDFTVKGSLTIHKWQAQEGNDLVEYVERGDGKTERWVLTTQTVDLVAEEFPLMDEKELLAAKQVYASQKQSVTTVREIRTLDAVTDTTEEHLIKARVVPSNVEGIPAAVVP